ncbi:uncharacterized protein EI90DRAFT_3138191 [Cantharellus anzutake]|uniref:uncharacterized protein n=1 Tax=Cantharellus anzutake TaxID=1750568 RepID=UPI001907F325|nr:uncharacterized protein EI90DRAFT_3138191 [Cantharellus anzutake]KAF8311655.1 hypothetical protein EI90DRAFT_3138191 [Cantharellus anzutake]
MVPMTASNVEVHNHAARPPIPKWMKVPLTSLMDGHYGHHAAPIPPPRPQGPGSSFGTIVAPTPQTSGTSVPSLIPEGYSWFAEANRSPPAGTWRNVLIPGTFFQGDFHFGVTISGQNWLVTESRNCRQKRWNDWVYLFLNSVEGFKFMVDLKWLDHEMRDGFDSTSLEACQLHGQFFDMKFVNGQNVSATELDGRFGVRPRNFENTIEAGKKYLLCCLWKHYHSEAAQMMKVTSCQGTTPVSP